MSTIKPSLPSGFKDYGPQQMLARERMIATIKEVYRRFGFVPLQTSTCQRRLALTGGVPLDNKLYGMRADGSDITTDEAAQLAARFDLTVPLARYVAEHIGKIRFPFRRYEIGSVFRGETPKPGDGRYCEFDQFDADTVGAPTGLADAEIIALMYEAMRALGVQSFLVRVSNRKLLDGLSERVGCQVGSTEARALLRLLDKAEEIGFEETLAELAVARYEDGTPGLGFSADRIACVREFLDICRDAKDNDERLSRLAGCFSEVGPGKTGVEELGLVVPLVRAAGVPETHWIIDPTVVRGLGYYSGTIFETTLPDLPRFGSVCSGGRFDDLIARFTGNSLPAVGTSIGVDRLFDALKAVNAIRNIEPEVGVYIVDMDSTLRPIYFEMAARLRSAGVRVEIGMSHQDASVKAQMAIALDRGAPVVLFCGAAEAAAGVVKVKNTQTRQQVAVPRDELVTRVLTILG